MAEQLAATRARYKELDIELKHAKRELRRARKTAKTYELMIEQQRQQPAQVAEQPPPPQQQQQQHPVVVQQVLQAPPVQGPVGSQQQDQAVVALTERIAAATAACDRLKGERKELQGQLRTVHDMLLMRTGAGCGCVRQPAHAAWTCCDHTRGVAVTVQVLLTFSTDGAPSHDFVCWLGLPAGALNSARDERAGLQAQLSQLSSRIVELEGANEALRCVPDLRYSIVGAHVAGVPCWAGCAANACQNVPGVTISPAPDPGNAGTLKQRAQATGRRWQARLRMRQRGAARVQQLSSSWRT